jgi:hypothetical protein
MPLDLTIWITQPQWDEFVATVDAKGKAELKNGSDRLEINLAEDSSAGPSE